ncbi:MAG: ABC transporter ATP-binding protein [Planctomycetes bacterium]|nr:ABC transporter ATP-binding protein [Planctomycetota bacterium]
MARATPADKAGEPILSVQDLSKVFRQGVLGRGGFPALKGVDLSVGRGTVFGLLGPNGAGKTTLVKILLGLVRGYGGTARVFGRPPKQANVRRRIGYLPEAHRMPVYLTGRQVMLLFGMLSGTPRALVEKRIDPLLERMNILDAADRKVREYSKGMQQRLGLAQALIHQPDLLFLDEPTDGVDPVGRMVIRTVVQELRAAGTTIFINSHLLMEVEMICDSVVIMDKGRILREGTIAELTPRTGRVLFDLVGEQEELPTLLSGLGANLHVHTLSDSTALELSVEGAEQDLVIDRLRSAGIGIRAVTPRRTSLEEAFVDLVEGTQQ